jgi:hypothetical protein
MVQISKQTYEEKMAMYMKLSKKELANMVIELNKLTGKQKVEFTFPPMPLPECRVWVAPANICTTDPPCAVCGKPRYSHYPLNGDYTYSVVNNV